MKRSLTPVLALAITSVFATILPAQSNNSEQAPKPRRSWTSDRREYAVGDVITVMVDEATLASATSSQNGSDVTSRKNGVGIVPPKIGMTELPTIDATLKTDKNATSSQRGDAQRDMRFHGDITVRVVAVDKSGLMQIKGTKTVDVDKNKQVLSFSGWIRPEDISRANVVISERVADASLTYQLSGALGKTRGGILGRLISVFWP